MATVNYTCPNCAAPLKFNPDKQMFSCEYCMSDFTEKYVQDFFAKKEQKENSAEKQEKKEQEKAKVEELNRKYGESFGYYNTVAEWYDVLTQKTKLKKRLLSTTAQAAVLRLLQQRQLRQQPASIVRILLFSAADFRVNLNPTV